MNTRHKITSHIQSSRGPSDFERRLILDFPVNSRCIYTSLMVASHANKSCCGTEDAGMQPFRSLYDHGKSAFTSAEPRKSMPVASVMQHNHRL